MYVRGLLSFPFGPNVRYFKGNSEPQASTSELTENERIEITDDIKKIMDNYSTVKKSKK